ncbi:MAG: hypothetical protein ACYC27_04160 [Armatimonadota bacterium]
MSIINRLRNIQVSPAMTGASIAILLIIAIAGVLIIKKVSSGTPSVNSNQQIDIQHSVASSASHVNVDTDKLKTGNTQQSAIDSCEAIAARNVFKSIGFTGTITESSVEPPANQGAGMMSLPPMPVGNFQQSSMPQGGFSFGFPGGGRSNNIAFTGIVNIPEGTMALLENTSTSESKYVAVGDTAFGMQVVDINPRTVSLSTGMDTIILSLGENKKESNAVTPQTTAAPNRQQFMPPPWMQPSQSQGNGDGSGNQNNRGNSFSPPAMPGPWGGNQQMQFPSGPPPALPGQ